VIYSLCIQRFSSCIMSQHANLWRVMVNSYMFVDPFYIGPCIEY
jgi:hypothetical protein